MERDSLLFENNVIKLMFITGYDAPFYCAQDLIPGTRTFLGAGIGFGRFYGERYVHQYDLTQYLEYAQAKPEIDSDYVDRLVHFLDIIPTPKRRAKRELSEDYEEEEEPEEEEEEQEEDQLSTGEKRKMIGTSLNILEKVPKMSAKRRKIIEDDIFELYDSMYGRIYEDEEDDDKGKEEEDDWDPTEGPVVSLSQRAQEMGYDLGPPDTDEGRELRKKIGLQAVKHYLKEYGEWPPHREIILGSGEKTQVCSYTRKTCENTLDRAILDIMHKDKTGSQ